MIKQNRTTKTSKQTKPLTRKQQAFVNTLLNNPKLSATQAVKQTYNVNNDNTASSIASENLRKPEIISKLQNYNELVENTLITDVIEYNNSDDINQRKLANDTARYIHDKINGKARQLTEVTSTGVTLNIDLTTSIIDELPTEVDQTK